MEIQWGVAGVCFPTNFAHFASRGRRGRSRKVRVHHLLQSEPSEVFIIYPLFWRVNIFLMIMIFELNERFIVSCNFFDYSFGSSDGAKRWLSLMFGTNMKIEGGSAGVILSASAIRLGLFGGRVCSSGEFFDFGFDCVDVDLWAILLLLIFYFGEQ